MDAKDCGRRAQETVGGTRPKAWVAPQARPRPSASTILGRTGARSRQGSVPPKVITVTSAETGAGRTTVTANLAVALGERGQRVLVLDADFAHPSIDALLGVEHRSDIGHLLGGQRTASEVIVPGPRGVQLILGSESLQKQSEARGLRTAALIWALDAVAQPLDVLVVDTAAGYGPEVATLAQAAHHVVVVVRDDPASICGTLLPITGLSRDRAVDHFKVLASQTRTLAAGASLFEQLQRDCDRLVDVTLEYAGAVPYDESVPSAISTSHSVVEADPGSPAALAFGELAARADAWPQPEGPRGTLEFFVERLVALQTYGTSIEWPQKH
jgi:flagellar biosynthesis protein FlhG